MKFKYISPGMSTINLFWWENHLLRFNCESQAWSYAQVKNNHMKNKTKFPSLKHECITNKFNGKACFGFAPSLLLEKVNFSYFKFINKFCFSFNPLSANPTKWSNTLKQFVGKLPTNSLNLFNHFVGLALKGLILMLIFAQEWIIF